MTSWSKSPAAVANRAKAAPRELCHHRAPGEARTACGREITSNTSMWLCLDPRDVRCPRCANALLKQGKMPDPVEWTVLRYEGSVGAAIGIVTGRSEGDALRIAISGWDSGFDTKTLGVTLAGAPK